MYRLYFKYNLQLFYWISLWAIVVYESNDQLLFYVILNKWLRNEYLQGEKFSTKLKKISSLFYMYDIECSLLNKHLNNRKNSTLFPRYQQASDQKCTSLDDISGVHFEIDILYKSVILQLNNNTISELLLLTVYQDAKKTKGIGCVKALLAIQLSGYMNLTNPVVSLWAIVTKGNNCAYKCFKTLSKNNNLSQEDTRHKSNALLSKVKKYNNKQFEKANLECCSCELGQRNRKMDIIFLNSANKVHQLMFDIKRLTKKNAIVRVMYQNGFRSINVVFDICCC